ncbi:hypothetical protein Bpfe_030324, partial [Biomphalaria pfeifferi]
LLRHPKSIKFLSLPPVYLMFPTIQIELSGLQGQKERVGGETDSRPRTHRLSKSTSGSVISPGLGGRLSIDVADRISCRGPSLD